MYLLKKFLLLILISFILIKPALSNDKVAFLDINFLVENSIFGKKILKELKVLDDQNISKLKLLEKKIKDKEKKINQTRNIVSEEKYNEQVVLIKNDIKKFRQDKEKMVKNFKLKKQEGFREFLKKIDPLLKDYMKQNSIAVLLDKKNVFIGKSEYDITLDLLKVIDNNLE